jgi:hypothetical protein
MQAGVAIDTHTCCIIVDILQDIDSLPDSVNRVMELKFIPTLFQR